jgi:50S ribosomal protein L16 3-hydroxylase
MNGTPLGHLSPDAFLRRHWQKKPLLVRGALHGIEAAFSVRAITSLACRDDVESRLVTHRSGRWHLMHGPFRRRDLDALPARGWSLLVQGVEKHLPQARALMNCFSFIPYARQDDLMVSIAPPGGGVGPHFDSYDVFLIQARGERRWRIGAQSDLRLVEDAPLRILRRFHSQEEMLVEPGDVLYLPPRYAHDGIATSECMTCSVGFRAPTNQELATGFLQWLQDDLRLEGQYGDPGLARQRHPAEIGKAMLERIEHMLANIKWRRADVERFLGEYLTEPKPQLWFTPPENPLGYAAFKSCAMRSGVRLALKSSMLFRGGQVFINGESVSVPRPARAALIALADRREVTPWPSAHLWASRQLYAWYRCGYVELA